MPARKRRSPPLVTIDRKAWKVLANLSANKDVERWGFLCGRRTSDVPACFRISEVVLMRAVKQTKPTKSSLVRELPHAGIIEEQMRADVRCDNPVGAWHTHVFDERCAASIMPQLSDADEKAVSDGTFVIICATYPLPPDPMRHVDKFFSIRARVKGKLCRAEAWLRVGSKFKPCEIKVR